MPSSTALKAVARSQAFNYLLYCKFAQFGKFSEFNCNFAKTFSRFITAFTADSSDYNFERLKLLASSHPDLKVQEYLYDQLHSGDISRQFKDVLFVYSNIDQSFTISYWLSNNHPDLFFAATRCAAFETDPAPEVLLGAYAAIVHSQQWVHQPDFSIFEDIPLATYQPGRALSPRNYLRLLWAKSNRRYDYFTWHDAKMRALDFPSYIEQCHQFILDHDIPDPVVNSDEMTPTADFTSEVGLYKPNRNLIDEAAALDHPLYRAFIRASIEFNAHPDEKEAFVAYTRSLHHLQQLPDEHPNIEEMWRLWKDMREQTQNQASSIYDFISNSFTEALNSKFKHLAMPMLLIPACLSFTTAVTSLISIFKDGSWIAGSAGLIASLLSMCYTVAMVIWGPIKFNQYITETTEAVQQKLTVFVNALFQGQKEQGFDPAHGVLQSTLGHYVEHPRPSMFNHDEVMHVQHHGPRPPPVPDYDDLYEPGLFATPPPSHPSVYGSIPPSANTSSAASAISSIRTSLANTVVSAEPTVDSFHSVPNSRRSSIAEGIDQAGHADYVKLGLSAASLLIGVTVCIVGGKTSSDFSNATRVLGGLSATALSAGGIYSMISNIVTDDGSQRRSDIGNDMTALHTALMDFQSHDDAFLATEGLEGNFHVLTDRFMVLHQLVFNEKDNTLTNHWKDLNLLYTKCQARYTQIRGTMIGVQARVEPVFVNFYGPPGVGKSTFVNNTLKPYLCGVLDSDPATGCIEMSGLQKYAPAFNGRAIAIIDEYMQINPEREDIPVITNMISSTPFKLDGASIELKNQYFNAEVVVTMSNRGTFVIAENVAPAETRDAFWHRHNFFYCVREGQLCDGGRGLTEGSFIRIFRSNGHTPSPDELETFKKMTPRGRIWSVPDPRPNWLIQELSVQDVIYYVTAKLVLNQDIFIKSQLEQRRVYEGVTPEQKIVTRYNLPPDFGKKYPLNTIFGEGHPMHDKVIDILDKLTPTENANIPERGPTARLLRRPGPEVLVNIMSVKNEVPMTPVRPIERRPNTQLPPPGFPPRRVEQPEYRIHNPLHDWKAGSSFFGARPKQPPVKSQLFSDTESLPGADSPLFTSQHPSPAPSVQELSFVYDPDSEKPAPATDQMGMKPLVLHVVGQTNTGKSYSWNRWMKNIAHSYNLSYCNTNGVIPETSLTNTVYLIDDVLPGRHEEYCQFWEKCDGSNVICLTSNMQEPDFLNRFQAFRFSQNWGASLVNASGSVRDCRYFPTEKLIRRAGVGGLICYNNNIYDVQSEHTMFTQESRGTVRHNDAYYSEVNIKPLLSRLVGNHLRQEVAVSWEYTTELPPTRHYDFDCVINPDTMHMITQTDFVDASYKHNDKVQIRNLDTSRWLDRGVFLSNRLVPRLLPKVEDIWEAREAFSGILKALLPQKANFTLLITIGQSRIYCTGDQIVRVYSPNLFDSSLRFDDTDMMAYASVSITEEIPIPYDDIVIILGMTPNHRAQTTDIRVRELILRNRDDCLRNRFVRNRMNQLERALYYEALRDNAKKEVSSMRKWIEEHPLISIMVGTLCAAGVLYTGVKIASKLFSSKPECDRDECTKVHYRLSIYTSDMKIRGHWYHSPKEAVKNWQYFPLQPLGLEMDETTSLHFLDHGHKEPPIGWNSWRQPWVHTHTCSKGHYYWVAHHPRDGTVHTDLDCEQCNPKAEGVDQKGAWGVSRPTRGRRRMTDEEYEEWKKSRQRRKLDGIDDVTMKSNSTWERFEHAASKAVDFVPYKYNAAEWAGTKLTPSDIAWDQAVIFPIKHWGEDQSLTNDTVALPRAFTGVEKKVLKNLVSVSTEHGVVKGLMIKGHIGITVSHILPDHGQLLVESEEYTGEGRVILVSRERDLAFFQISDKAPQFPNIEKYFASEEQVLEGGTVRAHLIRQEGHITTIGDGKFIPEFNYVGDGIDQIRKKRISVRYAQVEQLASVAGDCGTPYFFASPAKEARPIVGIHCTVQKVYNRSVFIAISKEDLESAFVQMDVGEDHADTTFECVEPVLAFTTKCHEPHEFLIDGNTKTIFESIDTGAPVHDLGDPVRCHPMGYSEKMYAPAGWKKNLHQPAPWTPELEGMGFENTCAPAAASANQVTDPSTLKTDHKGRPSIVATRMADANLPNGEWFPKDLQKQTERELADFYYPEVVRHDGTRFLNLHEIVNGVGGADTESNLAKMTMDSSPGIYYQKMFGIHKKAQLFCLIDGHYEIARTNAGNDLRQRFTMACRAVEQGKTLIDISNVKLKNELRPKEKIAVGKTRAFESEGIISYMIIKKYIGALFHAMSESRHTLHATVGADSATEAPIYYKRLTKFAHVFGRDHSSLDKSIMEQLLLMLRNIIALIFVRAAVEGINQRPANELRKIVKGVFGHIIYSVENLEGTILFLYGVMNSGIFGTSIVDSLLVDISSVVCIKLIIASARAVSSFTRYEHEFIVLPSGTYPTLRAIHEHCDWIVCGDDCNTVVDEEYGAYVDFTSMQATLLRVFGIRSTPPDKTDSLYRFGTIEGESFCSRFFVGTYPFVTWALKKQSIERQLFWCSELDSSLISTQMIYGVLPEAARWQDEAYYNRIRRAVIFILDWFKMADETIDYHTAIALEKQRLGLIEAFSRGPTSKFSFENEVIARREKFLESHKQVKTMYKRCNECNVDITSYVAYWKHVANSHPKEFVTVTCPECSEPFDCDSWRVHDHRPAACRVPGCVAKPRNLTSKDCHAATHAKTYSQCFGENAVDQSGAATGIDKLCLHDSNIYSLGEDLIRVHLEQASLVSEHFGFSVAVLGRKDIPWKTSVQEVPNVGTRRLQYTGDSFASANEIGYFGETLEKYQPKDFIAAFRKFVPNGFCIVMRRGTLFIDVNGEDQSEGLNLGMPGAAPMGGAMGSIGIAANIGAMGPIAYKAPPAIVDGMNTVAAAINMNTLGVDPDMILMGGRSDDLKTLALTQKYLLSSTQVSTTTAANTRVGKIFYGMAAGRIAEWMKLHKRFSGTLKYEIQIVGNGSLTGSLAIGWYQGSSTDDPPAPQVGSAFYDVNWTVMAVNQSSSIGLELVDTRKDTFWRPLHYDWAPETGFVTGFGPGLGIFVKDPIQNPFGAESSVTLNIYVAAGADFMPIEPTTPVAKELSKLQTSLAEIIGAEGFLSLDNPYPSAVPGAISLWKATIDQVGPSQGFAGLLNGDAPAQTLPLAVPMAPDVIPFEKGKKWSSFTTENSGNRAGLYALGCQNTIYGSGLRIYGTGYATENDVSKSLYALAALGIVRPGQEPGSDPLAWYTAAFATYRKVFPVMFTPMDDNVLEMQYGHSTVSPIGRGSMWFVGMAERTGKPNWGAGSLAWLRYKGQIQAPKLVIGSENYDLQTVGQSPYCALLNVTTAAPPGVARQAAKTVVATYPDSATYALLDWCRSRSLNYNGSALSFTIREVRSNRVVASCVYDYDQGVIYTTVKSGQIKHQLCTLKNMAELMITDVTPTTAGSNPPPIPDDLWVQRLVESNAADQAVRDLRRKMTYEHIRECNPLYREPEQEQSDQDELGDIDETIFAPGEDQANAAQNAIVRHQQLLQQRLFAHETKQKYRVAERGMVLDHNTRNHGINTTAATDRAKLGLETTRMNRDTKNKSDRLVLDSNIADKAHKLDEGRLILDMTRANNVARHTADRINLEGSIADDNAALGRGRLALDGSIADDTAALGQGRLALDTNRLDADTAIRSTLAENDTAATTGAIANAEKRIELDTKRHASDSMNNALKTNIEAKKVNNEHALGKDRIAAGTAIESNKIASSERMQAAEHNFKAKTYTAQSTARRDGSGAEWAPQSASGSMIAGGAAIGQGLGNLIGGIGGMYMASKEFGLNEARTKDAMRMQQNDNATAINMQKIQNGMDRAQAMASMQGVDAGYGQVFQPGTLLSTNYESHA